MGLRRILPELLQATEQFNEAEPLLRQVSPAAICLGRFSLACLIGGLVGCFSVFAPPFVLFLRFFDMSLRGNQLKMPHSCWFTIAFLSVNINKFWASIFIPNEAYFFGQSDMHCKLNPA